MQELRGTPGRYKAKYHDCSAIRIQTFVCVWNTGGVHVAAEHQSATLTALTGLAVLLLPGAAPHIGLRSMK